VHRDLKPKNVIISRRGQRPFLKVLDFGIAKILLGSELDPTTVGKVLGSVLYISPEQVLAQPLDHRADIFSLGTIIFEVITLTRAWARNEENRPLPFHHALDEPGSNNSHISVLRRIAREERPKATLERSDISPAVDDVLARAMAVNAAERFDSADDLARALRMALIAPARPSRSRVGAVRVPEASELAVASEATEPEPIVDPADAKPARPRALPSFRSGKKSSPFMPAVDAQPEPPAQPSASVFSSSVPVAHEASESPTQPTPVVNARSAAADQLAPFGGAPDPGVLAKPPSARGPSTAAVFGAMFFVVAAAIVVLAYFLAH
jgi:serine/threonine-protein kinase